MANGGTGAEPLSPFATHHSLLTAFPTPRAGVSHILDTFPIVKRKDEEKHGRYRTKRTILEIHDAMAESICTGQPYATRLNPVAAHRACRHLKKKIGILAFGSLIADPGKELSPKSQNILNLHNP